MKLDFSALLHPIETAKGLPNAHYTDPDIHAKECQDIIAKNWAGVDVCAEIPKPGDAKPIIFLNIPLLLLRGHDGKVRVFNNICRHRGMILVEKARRIKGAIRCPYHSWCYGSDGALISTPHVGGPGTNIHPAIKRDELGLLEVKSHIWHDVIFVNLSNDAPDFEEVNADLIQRWKEFDQPLFHGGKSSHFTLDAKCNWKLAVENYSESYHLPWVHPGLNSYSRLEDHYNISEPLKYCGQGTKVYRQLKDDDGTCFPDFKRLSKKWTYAAEYITAFPNVMLGVHRDHLYAIILEPVSHNQTREHIHLYYASPKTDAKLRKKNAKLWKQVFEEDIFVVEGMQSGRNAPQFDGGRFSPVMEMPTYCFHEWVAKKLIETRSDNKT